MSPAVSANLCCYNSEKYLEDTLKSICAQTYNDWELVIVNDGSTDSTEQIVQKYMAEGWPIIYHAQANAGLGRSRNKAIELSHGEFIALIDHDDLWHPEKLEMQMALFAGRPQLGLAFTNVIQLYPKGDVRTYSHHNRLYRGDVVVQLVLSNFVVSSAVVVRRTVLDEVGWLNPDFTHAVDYDLMIRIAEKYEFDYTDQPLVTFRYHLRNTSWDGTRMQAETIALMGQALKRTPRLALQLGPNATRLKRAGLSCTMGHAYLLQGRLREALQWYGSAGRVLKVLPRVASLCLLSFLPPNVVVKLIGQWRAARRRLILH